MIKIRYLKNIPPLSKGSEGAVGYDVTAAHQSYRIDPGTSVLIGTGIALEMPDHMECQVRPRSGLSTKQHLIIPNSPGTIDQDFVGEIMVCLFNIGSKMVHIAQGQRIAQLVFSRICRPNFTSVRELSATKRGEGGFGSSGT